MGLHQTPSCVSRTQYSDALLLTSAGTSTENYRHHFLKVIFKASLDPDVFTKVEKCGYLWLKLQDLLRHSHSCHLQYLLSLFF